MILLLGLLGCSQEPFVFKRKPDQCRQTQSHFKTETKGTLKERTQAYIWEEKEAGARVDFQTPSFINGRMNTNYQIYNAQGFLIEEYSEESVPRKTSTEYSCTDESCWRAKTKEEIGSEVSRTTIEKEYSWDGKVEEYKTVRETSAEYVVAKTGTHIAGHTVYNDYGYPVEEYHKLEGGYREVQSEYDCSEEWCKLLSQRQKYFISGRIPVGFQIKNLDDLETAIKLFFTNKGYTSEDVLEFSWDENKQEWKTAGSRGYRVYNDYGFVTEYFVEGIKTKSWTYHSYDCGDE